MNQLASHFRNALREEEAQKEEVKTPVSMEQVLLDINELGQEIGVECDASEKSTNALMGMENMVTLIDTALEQEHIDATTVTAISTAMESILDADGVGMEGFGLEAYDGEQDTREWLQVSQERIKDKIAGAFEYLSGGFDKIVEVKTSNLKGAMAEVKNYVGFTNKFVEKNKEEIQKLAIGEQEFYDFLRVFIRKGKPVKELSKAIDDEIDIVGKWSKFIGGEMKEYFTAISKALDTKVDSDESAEQLLKDLKEIRSPLLDISRDLYGEDAFLNSYGLEKDEEKDVKFDTDLGDFGKRVVMRTTQTSYKIDLAELIPYFGIFVEAKKNTHTLKVEDLLKVGGQFEKLVDHGNTIADELAELLDLYKDIQQKLEKILKNVKDYKISKEKKKDIAKLSYLNTYLKTIIRTPCFFLINHLSGLAKMYGSMQSVYKDKVEKDKKNKGD